MQYNATQVIITALTLTRRLTKIFMRMYLCLGQHVLSDLGLQLGRPPVETLRLLLNVLEVSRQLRLLLSDLLPALRQVMGSRHPLFDLGWTTTGVIVLYRYRSKLIGEGLGYEDRVQNSSTVHRIV